MPVPAPIVLGVTGAIHLSVVGIFGVVGYLSYKAFKDYNDNLMEDVGYDAIIMIAGFLLLLWIITILIRADRTLRRTHDILREKYGFNSYDDAYRRQLRYIFPVNIIKNFIENKLVIPYSKHDGDYKIINMFAQIIIDADDDIEAPCSLNNHSHNHEKDKKCDSESEKLIPSKQKCCNCDH
eukprot:489955_1